MKTDEFEMHVIEARHYDRLREAVEGFVRRARGLGRWDEEATKAAWQLLPILNRSYFEHENAIRAASGVAPATRISGDPPPP